MTHHYETLQLIIYFHQADALNNKPIKSIIFRLHFFINFLPFYKLYAQIGACTGFTKRCGANFFQMTIFGEPRHQLLYFLSTIYYISDFTCNLGVDLEELEGVRAKITKLLG